MTSESNTSESADKQPIPRLGFFDNLKASYTKIRTSVKDEGKNIRKSDPLTIWMVPGLAVALVFASASGGIVRLLVAFLAYFSACIYVAARIGIVRSMNSRQVNLVWHIIMCSFIAGILFAFLFLSLLNEISTPERARGLIPNKGWISHAQI